MSQWFGAGRHKGRHAAGSRGRAKAPAAVDPRPPVPVESRPAGPPLSAPVAAEPKAGDSGTRLSVGETDPGAGIAATVPPGSAPLITIDALGRKCPMPIIMLAEQIRDVPVGAVIAVLADDPAAYTDVPAWCSLKSHECAFRVDHSTGWSFGVRRHY